MQEWKAGFFQLLRGDQFVKMSRLGPAPKGGMGWVAKVEQLELGTPVALLQVPWWGCCCFHTGLSLRVLLCPAEVSQGRALSFSLSIYQVGSSRPLWPGSGQGYGAVFPIPAL